MSPLNDKQKARLAEWLDQFFHSEGDTWDHADWFDFDACVSALAPALELPHVFEWETSKSLTSVVTAQKDDWDRHSAAVKAIVGEPE